MLVDLCDFLKPDLCIVDGILAMEGNGPTGGKPREAGGAGSQQKPLCPGRVRHVPHRHCAGEHPDAEGGPPPGAGLISPEECRLVKEGIAPLAQPDFLKAEASSTDFIDRLPKVLRPAAKKFDHAHPEDPQSGVCGLRQVCGKLPPAHHPDPGWESGDPL